LLQYGGSYAGAYLLRRGLFMPWELDAVVKASIARLGLRRLNPIWHIERQLRPQPRTSFAKVAALESSLYMRNQLLRDTDWASMAHSLEVRVPLVDAKLLRDVAPLTTKNRLPFKHVLANSPSLRLPANVVERPKTGFTTPIETWLKSDSRIQRWRRVPAFAIDTCPWARRWAFEVAAA
jgi:asparagine synthase (glutamine-hydrolysing)